MLETDYNQINENIYILIIRLNILCIYKTLMFERDKKNNTRVKKITL